MMNYHCYVREVGRRVVRKLKLSIGTTLGPRIGQSASLSISGGESETFGKQWFAGIPITWSGLSFSAARNDTSIVHIVHGMPDCRMTLLFQNIWCK
jgi:hypothetical protein